MLQYHGQRWGHQRAPANSEETVHGRQSVVCGRERSEPPQLTQACDSDGTTLPVVAGSVEKQKLFLYMCVHKRNCIASKQLTDVACCSSATASCGTRTPPTKQGSGELLRGGEVSFITPLPSSSFALSSLLSGFTSRGFTTSFFP